jgi:phage shock protein PspC (stress-responsive transcriptional regulator)
VKNPLDSLWGTAICGVILTVILYFVANLIMPHVAAGGGT